MILTRFCTKQEKGLRRLNYSRNLMEINHIFNDEIDSSLTRTVGCKETFPLDGSVALKHHVHLISGCQDWMWLFGAAKFAQNVTIRRIAIINGDMIVVAFLMGFHLENFENLEGFRNYIKFINCYI